MSSFNRKYYASLDLLRILAAAGVAFFFHYLIILGDSPLSGTVIGDFLNKNGGWGVEIFFVISGFVVYNAYGEKIRNKKTVFTSFLLDRIIRLYPAVIITVVVIWVLIWTSIGLYGEPVSDAPHTILLAVILNLFCLNGGTIADLDNLSVNGPTWYITVLLICYIIFYAVVNNSKGSKGVENVCFVAMILIGMSTYFHAYNVPFLFLSNGRGYVFFFLGVLIAQLEQKVKKRGRILLCIGAVALFLIYLLAKEFDLLIKSGLETGLCVICPIVILFVCFTPLHYICDNAFVKFLGGISFGIFLWNIPVFVAVLFVEKVSGASFDYGDILTYLLIVGINILSGILSYIFIDKKLVAKLKQIKESHERKKQEISGKQSNN